MSVSFIESQMQSKIQEMMNLLTQLQIEKNKTENTQSQEKKQLIKQNQDLFELNQWYQKKLDKKLKKIETLKKKNKNLQKKLDTYDTYGHENVPKMGTFDKGTFGTLDEIELEAEEDEVQCIEPPVIFRKIKIEDLTKDEPVLEPDEQDMLDELVEIATRAVRKGFLEVKQLKKMEAVVDLEVQDHAVQDHAVQDHEVQEEEEQEEEVEVQVEEETFEEQEQEEVEEQEEEVEVEETVEEEVEVEEEEEVEVEEEVEEEEEVEVEDHEVQEVEVEVEEEEEVQEVEQEQEEEEEEEQELILVKINKKNYYTTNETNGEIYAIEEDESIGDQVGNYKNGKAFFLPKK